MGWTPSKPGAERPAPVSSHRLLAVLRLAALRVVAVVAGLISVCLVVLTLVPLLPFSELGAGRALDALSAATAAWMMAATGLRLWQLADSPPRTDADPGRDVVPSRPAKHDGDAHPGRAIPPT